MSMRWFRSDLRAREPLRGGLLRRPQDDDSAMSPFRQLQSTGFFVEHLKLPPLRRPIFQSRASGLLRQAAPGIAEAGAARPEMPEAAE